MLTLLIVLLTLQSLNARNVLLSNILHLLNRYNEEINVSFSLYTPKNSIMDLYNIQSEDLGNVAPFKFIIHGWTESPSRGYFKTMTEAYFQRGNYNVVHVNWSVPASADYSSTVSETISVGNIIGAFILRICEISPATLKDIHILGHSLGAHVAGIAGKYVFEKTGNKAARITGLDPAGPLFEGFLGDPAKVLNKNDAEMVDVVHTDGGFFGYKHSMGTVDFFPNGGTAFQPGCTPFESEGVLDVLDNPVDYVFCSHKKSHTYYIESIGANKNIMAVKCNSWMEFKENLCDENDTIPFGEDVPLDAKGDYYFRINSPTK